MGPHPAASHHPIDRTELMRRPAGLVVLAALSVGAAFLGTRLLRGHGPARPLAGGILIEQVVAYDHITGILLAPFFRSIATDIVAAAAPGTRVLDVGCGPGHLAALLAADHRLEVTGLDLDPAMVERARTNVQGRSSVGPRSSASFVVGDVAALPFEPGSFDLVVSSFALHHWADPEAGIGEIARVLRTGGRALIWDLGPSVFARCHGHVPDPTAALNAGDMRVVSARPWHWPWRFGLTQRIELLRD